MAWDCICRGCIVQELLWGGGAWVVITVDGGGEWLGGSPLSGEGYVVAQWHPMFVGR